MDFIKKLLGGILGFIKGIFGIFKKSEYYLEAEGSDSAPAEKAAPAKVEAEKAAPAKAEATPAAPASQPIPETNPPKPVELVQTASGVVAAPVSKGDLKADGREAKVAKQPVTVGAETLKTFAPEFLASTRSSGDRRRPGPSMSPFMGMARQMSKR